MTDNYKRGLVTGLAMQPLCVVQKQAEAPHENYCEMHVTPINALSNEGYCRFIDFEEG